jgi:DNA-binding NarL/FixJ family response regulator
MIRLAFVEDNLSYRTALQVYIETVPDITLVCAQPNLHNIHLLLASNPDVVIMDIDLGKDSGIDGVQVIRAALPRTAILMLTVFEDEVKIFASINAGAVGYLLKKDPPERIMEAVRAVYKGEGAINGLVARKIMEHFPAPAKEKLKLDDFDLTKREKEIVILLIEGYSYKEIADKCYVAIDTVNSHIRKIYSKLGIHTRSEIAARLK